MGPKFARSKSYTQLSEDAESEVLDAYEHILLTGSEDVLLRDMPKLLRDLKIPPCFTNDIVQCIQWFYDTEQDPDVREHSTKWTVAVQLLRHLTISTVMKSKLDVSDIVDIDKLTKFCCRLVKFRDNFSTIKDAWSLFVTAAGIPKEEALKAQLTLRDLLVVKKHLLLDDIADSILIDMLSCGKSADGELLNYRFTDLLSVGIKDFAEVLGQIGELD